MRNVRELPTCKPKLRDFASGEFNKDRNVCYPTWFWRSTRFRDDGRWFCGAFLRLGANIWNKHYIRSPLMRLKHQQLHWLFNNFFQANSKQASQFSIIGPLWVESIGHRTKARNGQHERLSKKPWKQTELICLFSVIYILRITIKNIGPWCWYQIRVSIKKSNSKT